jgi:thiol-disulfide isomerase/thioredoxin
MKKVFILSLLAYILSISSAFLVGVEFQFFVAGFSYFLASKTSIIISNLKKIHVLVILASPFLLSYGLYAVIIQEYNSYPTLVAVIICILLGLNVGSNEKKRTYYLSTITIGVLLFIGSIVFMPNYLSYVDSENRFRNEKVMSLKLINFSDSSKIDISHLNGKVLILSFWTTRCGACFEEFSALNTFYKKIRKDQRVILFAVNLPILGDSASRRNEIINKYIKNKNYKFPIAISLQNYDEISNKIGFTGVPTVIVIDKQGVLRYSGLFYTKKIIIYNIDRIIHKLLKD